MNILLAKTALTAAALVALALALLWLKDDARATRAAGWLDVRVAWLLTRFLPWLALYVAAGQTAHSDVATTFWPQAAGALAGGLPYRDFLSSFSPLFSYLLALPALLWPDPRALILFLTALEAVAAALTLRAAEIPPRSATRARWLALYFLAPGPLLLAVVGGQEDFLLWLGGLLVWLALARRRDFAAGVIAVVAALFTKPLFLLPAAACLGLSRHRWRFLAGAVPLALVTLALLRALTGDAFLQVLRQTHNVSPPNVWIWLHWLSGGLIPIGSPLLASTMLALVLAFAAVYFAWQARAIRSGAPAFFAAWTVLFALSMLLNLKSLGAYFGYFALPSLALFFLRDDRFALALWLALGALAPLESSLWHRLDCGPITGLPATPLVALEYALQGAMLACLAGLALAAHRVVRASASA